MKKSLIFILSLALSVESANALDPEIFSTLPSNCKAGAVKSANISVGGDQCNTSGCEDYDYDYSFDYLAAVSSKHILVNGTHRVKGDGAYYYSKGDDIYFYDSLGGYRGKSKSNLEGNAYLTYNMTMENNHGLGSGWVWVMKNIYSEPWCSKRAVYFQNKPRVIKQSSLGVSGNFVTVKLGWEISNYSRAALESNTNAIVILKATSDWYNTSSTKSVSVSSISGSTTLTVNTTSSGPNIISARVYDGTYYGDTLELGMIMATGSSNPPCPRCNKN